MRRLEAGPPGKAKAPTTAPATGASLSQGEGGECGGRVTGAIRTPNDVAAQVAVFPGARQALTPGRRRGSRARTSWHRVLAPGFPSPDSGG